MKDLKYISKFIFQYKIKQVIAFLCLILNSLFTYLIAYAMMKIIDSMTVFSDIKVVLFYIILYIGSAISSNILILVADYIFLKISRKAATELKLELCGHMMKFDGQHFVNTKTGELLTILEDDIEKIQNVFGKKVPSFLTDVLTSMPIIIFALYIEKFIIIALCIVVLLTYFMQKYYIKKIHFLYTECRESISQSNSVFQEFVSQLLDIIALNANAYFGCKIKKKLSSVEDTYVQYGFVCNMRSFWFSMFSVITVAVIFCIGGYGIMQSTISIGAIMAMIGNFSKIIAPFVKISDFSASYQECKVALKRVNSILQLYTSEKEKDYNIEDICSISFKNVKFAYNESQNVLQGVTLKIDYGKITALVGESGCGKTTIINLLLRLWTPQKGMIYVNDTPVDYISKDDIRKNISIVSQNTVLFDDTILNNICLNNKEVSENQVISICKKCGIYDFIRELPDGLNTVIGERGVKLSGGQKQRIEIVRALISDRPIIIFDEATSALDNNSENIIKDTIESIKQTHIIIVIAHRLTTIENADMIYVLENGKIAESGVHDQLISLNGQYAKLYRKDK